MNLDGYDKAVFVPGDAELLSSALLLWLVGVPLNDDISTQLGDS